MVEYELENSLGSFNLSTFDVPAKYIYIIHAIYIYVYIYTDKNAYLTWAWARPGPTHSAGGCRAGPGPAGPGTLGPALAAPPLSAWARPGPGPM